jgi:hypothetical protein
VGRDCESAFADWYVFFKLFLTSLRESLEANRVLVVFFLTLFVRQQLAPVDMQELREARYGLKGA